MFVFDADTDPECLLRFSCGFFGIIIPLQIVLSTLCPLPSRELPLPSEAATTSLPSPSWTFLPLLQAVRPQLKRD